MEIERLIVGNLQANCYILRKGKFALIIDPGDEGKLIQQKTKDLLIEAVLLTHHHKDHIGAINYFNNENIIDIYNQEKTEHFNFEIIKTPGHTNDSVTYYFKEEKIMFTGDFLFQGTIGRTDLPTGNSEEMKKSIEKIKKYPPETIIYPGHGESSTLEKEIKTNPYL